MAAASEAAKQRRQEYHRTYHEKRRAENLEAVRARDREAMRRWRAKPENKAKEYARREANREKVRVQTRESQRRRRLNPEVRQQERERRIAYYYANHEQEREKAAAWFRKHPAKTRELAARRRARKRAQTAGRVDYDAIVKRDGLVCHLCGEPVARDVLHFDHVIPLAKGGPHSMGNIKIAHGRCNQRKHDKVIV